MHPIDVRDLLGHPGASKVERLRETIGDLGTELARVPEDMPVEGELLLESVLEGILATGRLSGTMSLRCARCLKEFTRDFDVEVAGELFTPRPAEDADDYPLDPGGELDPEQLVRDAVGLELPFSPLCTPGCQGLCTVCGGDRNLGECPGHEETDPRWADLATLFATPDDGSTS
jgi:DUF177 domain-containing protein